MPKEISQELLAKLTPALRDEALAAQRSLVREEREEAGRAAMDEVASLAAVETKGDLLEELERAFGAATPQQVKAPTVPDETFAEIERLGQGVK